MKSILTTKTNFMLGTVSLLALAALTTSFMTTATPAAFAQPNGEIIKKICGDTAVSFKKGTCYYPITEDCSSFPGSFPSGSGSCLDPLTGLFVGFAQIVCNHGGESDGDNCVGKPTGPKRQ
jgi:hypothetical protein